MDWSNECITVYKNITRNERIYSEHLLMDKRNSEIKGLLAEIEKGTYPELRSELIMKLIENNQKFLYFKDKVEGAGIYTFSVMVRPLMEYDKTYFTDVFWAEGGKIGLNNRSTNRVIDVLYKPYYYEAVMYTGDDTKKQSMIEKRLEEAYENGEKWIAIREDKKLTQENFHLRTQFSASPYKTEDLYVSWEATVANGVNNIFEEYKTNKFDYVGCPDGREIFEKLFTGVKTSRVNVLRVGEGSANYGKIENVTGEHEYFFDVGLPIDRHCPEGEAEKHLHNKVEKYFANKKIEAVILSHWHTDHIKGAFLLQDLDKIKWIAPPLMLSEIGSPSIQRLGCYLYSKKRLAKVSMSNDQLYSCGEFALYRGTSSTRGDLNNKCLMLQLHSTLLPGDCEFACWPKDFGKNPLQPNYKYKHLVFPHHGAFVESGEDRIDCMENDMDTLVIIPTGYNLYGKKDNRYPSHPAENYNVFQGKKYTVFPTNPTNNENIGTRLLAYYDKDALSAKVDVQDPDPQIRKANSNFSLRDKPC